MSLAYCRVSPHNAELILKYPSLIHRFLSLDDEPPKEGSFWKNLFGFKSKEENPPSLEPRTDGDEGDTDKAWHAIYYLLTGSADDGSFPECFIQEGGNAVGDEEVGYGEARLFEPAEVSLIASMLDNHTEETLKERYAGKAMDKAGIYPKIWGQDEENNFAYVWENFALMREFIHASNDSRSHLLLYFI